MFMEEIKILLVGFTRDDSTSRVVPELRALSEKGIINIIDLLFAKKDLKGNILALKERELTADEAVRFGSIAGTLIGLDIFEDEGITNTSEIEHIAVKESDFGSYLKDIAIVIEKIPKDSSFGIILVENCRTIELNKTLNDAGGVLLAQGLVSPLALAKIDAEIAEYLRASAKRKETLITQQVEQTDL